MYLDWSYIILVLPAVIFAMVASARVSSVYRKYSEQRSRRGITGAQAARRILDANGLNNVRLERVSGNLTDHYDPRSNIIRLSDSVYDNPSAAAVGIACHEVGHALQYASGYQPIKLRMAIIPVTQIGSKLAVPLVMVGLILDALSGMFLSLAYIGIALFALCTVFQLITLPIEYNASNRARGQISACGLLYDDEVNDVRKVLNAAAMTYVASLAVSLMQLLRLLMIVSGRRSRD